MFKLIAEETMSQVCSRFGIHPTQARRWKEKHYKLWSLVLMGSKFALDAYTRIMPKAS